MKFTGNIILITFLIAIVGVGLSCSQSAKNSKKVEEKAVYKVEKLWSTDQVFDVPESVCYDKERDVLYVANIVGKPSEKDGLGFISKMKTNGDIIELKWVTGLDAPKGMGVYNGKLYVANVDEIVEIDIIEGKEIARYACQGAAFANDIAISENGIVYLSDTQNGGIYKFDGEKVTLLFDQGTFKRPNGLFTTKENLFIGTANTIYKVDYAAVDTVAYIKNTDPVDGLEQLEKDVFLKSDWQGRVHLVKPGEEKVELTNTIKQKVNAADIEYIPEQNLMLVPTFFHNSVVAYKISK